MNEKNLGWRSGTLVAVGMMIILFTLQLYSGGIFTTIYWADSLFVLDVVSRIREGQIPHEAFMLHIGALPFFGISAFSKTSVIVGYFAGQFAFTSIMLVAAVWICRTRLEGISSAFLLFSIVVIGMSVSAGASDEITLALFYNRWAWLPSLLLVVACFSCAPPKRWAWQDGAVLGALAFVILVTKITFFVALVPLAFLSYLLARRWHEIAGAIGAFMVLCLASTLFLGLEFWIGYLDNLAWVARNPLRQYAGVPLPDMLLEPKLLGYYICYLIFLAVILRFRGIISAIWQLMLAISFIFIQYQNFGNTPYWIIAIAVFSIAARSEVNRSCPEEQLQWRFWTFMSVASVVLSVLLLYPPLKGNVRNFSLAKHPNFVALVPNVPALAGVAIHSSKIAPIQTDIRALDVDTSVDNPLKAFGISDQCVAKNGEIGILQEATDVIASLPGPAFVADVIGPYWFMADTEAPKGAAPWNYGSLRGLEYAEFVVVPKCPIKPKYQRVILENLVASKVQLRPYRDTKWMSVFAKGPVE